MEIESIAKVCYEADRAVRLEMGGKREPWNEAKQDVKDEYFENVRYMLANPKAGPTEYHDAWMVKMEAMGWKEGPKNARNKTIPDMVPFRRLPVLKKARIVLFMSVFNALKILIGA